MKPPELAHNTQKRGWLSWERASPVDAPPLSSRGKSSAKFAKIGPVIGVVSQPIVLLIIAAVFWVMFKLAGGDFDFGTSFAVTSYGMMPGAVAALLSIPVVMSKSTLSYQEVKAGNR